MKKYIILFLIILIMTFGIVVLLKSDNNLKRISRDQYELDTSSVTIVNDAQTTENYSTQHIIIPNDELTYTNELAGYKITFPDNWKNRYIITEYNPGEVCVGFYGESETGQSAYKDSLGRYGLDLGWIVDHAHIPSEGSRVVGKIAEIDNVEYFITTPRGGAYLPQLAVTMNDSDNTFDENEKQLASEDGKKAIIMSDDWYGMNFKVEIL